MPLVVFALMTWRLISAKAFALEISCIVRSMGASMMSQMDGLRIHLPLTTYLFLEFERMRTILSFTPLELCHRK